MDTPPLRYSNPAGNCTSDALSSGSGASKENPASSGPSSSAPRHPRPLQVRWSRCSIASAPDASSSRARRPRLLSSSPCFSASLITPLSLFFLQRPHGCTSSSFAAAMFLLQIRRLVVALAQSCPSCCRRCRPLPSPASSLSSPASASSRRRRSQTRLLPLTVRSPIASLGHCQDPPLLPQIRPVAASSQLGLSPM